MNTLNENTQKTPKTEFAAAPVQSSEANTKPLECKLVSTSFDSGTGKITFATAAGNGTGTPATTGTATFDPSTGTITFR